MATNNLPKQELSLGKTYHRMEGALLQLIEDLTKSCRKRGDSEDDDVPQLLRIIGVLSGMQQVASQDLFEQLAVSPVGMDPEELEALCQRLEAASSELERIAAGKVPQDELPDLAKLLAAELKEVEEELQELAVEVVEDDDEDGGDLQQAAQGGGKDAPLPGLDL